MNIYFRNLSAEKNLRIAAILCFVASALLPIYVWVIWNPKSSSVFNSLAAYLFHGVVFFGVGIGLKGKKRWARYVGVFVSVFAGATLLIVFFVVILSLFDLVVVRNVLSFVVAMIVLVIATIPGYILLRPEVKNLFSTKES